MAEGALAIATILAAGVGAQYLAAKVKVPSILLLLPAGFAIGPLLGWVHPDQLLGDLLPAIVALGVAVILFEGGLGLDFREVRAHGRVVTMLVTAGVVVTTLVGATATHYLFGLTWPMGFLAGAILSVSGPTVVLPLLRQVRAKRNLESVLRWEGILIDPIGAILAVIAFDVVVSSAGVTDLPTLLADLLATLGTGVALGIAFGGLLVFLERRYWIPDFLVAAVSLALVIIAFTASDLLRPESGLMTVTVMGVTLANQRSVSVHHLIDFKENLSVLLIGGLFVLLAARVDAGGLLSLAADPASWIFVAILVLVARPVGVWISSIGSGLGVREQAFLAAMAPRGIVAAAVSAFFAIRLEGVPGAELLVPLTFLVIVATVVLYGIAARPTAKALGLVQPPPEGVLLVGANAVTREFAQVLQEQGFAALIVDTDKQAISATRVQGLRAVMANVHSTHLAEAVDLEGIGRLWAVTPREETNALAAVHFADEFGRARVCQIASGAEAHERHPLARHLKGRTLFTRELTYQRLRDRLTGDWEIKRTPITDEFGPEEYLSYYPDAVPLWAVTEDRVIQPWTTDSHPEIRPGKTIVALVRKRPREEDGNAEE